MLLRSARSRSSRTVLAALAVAAIVLGTGVASPAATSGEGEPEAARAKSSARWTKVATEQFAGPLDSSRWAPFQGVPGCCSDTVWSPTQVKASDGVLTLRNNPVAGTWLSGGVGSWNWPDATRQYGRWDARIRLDAGEGISATALLFPREGWPPELNFFEIFETWGARSQSMVTTHWLDGGKHAVSQQTVEGDFRRWHVFSIRWTADRLVYVIDGKVVQVETDPARIPDEPMWVGFQTHAHRDANGRMPQLPAGRKSVRMQVDWLKVFAPAA
ncbi:glycoside hydrolase family 16 protein [Nocardioides ferulae]|uniref:glycoside hydrolase family 16 protein n=1 Tax=Nocardioides ferulae TaxID=2340821 RepID=UPI0013DDEF49|nr:glycoside hydrolase family 16 protein [Nocardioides ferulae]